MRFTEDGRIVDLPRATRRTYHQMIVLWIIASVVRR